MNIISHKSCISNKKTPINGYNCNTVLRYRSILPVFPCLQGKTVRKGKRKFSCRHRIAGVYPHRKIRTRGGGNYYAYKWTVAWVAGYMFYKMEDWRLNISWATVTILKDANVFDFVLICGESLQWKLKNKKSNLG